MDNCSDKDEPDISHDANGDNNTNDSCEIGRIVDQNDHDSSEDNKNKVVPKSKRKVCFAKETEEI